jgi:hypothetical protein
MGVLVVNGFHVLRRALAAIVPACLLVVASCVLPPDTWRDTNLNLEIGDGAWEPTRGAAIDVGCGPPGICLAVRRVDTVPGQATVTERWDGSMWMPDTTAPPLSQGGCATARICAGITANGVAGWNGVAWQQLTDSQLWGPSPGMPRYNQAISCGADGCVVIDSGRTAVWNGSAWRNPSAPVAASRLSCVSTSWCLAAGASGAVSRWQGTAWSTAADISHPGDGVIVTAVTCWRVDGCAVAASLARLPLPGEPPTPADASLYQWNGTALIPGVSLGGALDLACSSANQCIAVRGAQVPLVNNSTGWQERPLGSEGSGSGPAYHLAAASCSPGWCMAAGQRGSKAAAFRFTFGAS